MPMVKPTESRIDELIAEAEKVCCRQDAYPFLTEIIAQLKQMRCSLDACLRDRGRMAGALGRLVTESYDFSESTLGTRLLGFADDFGGD